MQRGTYVEVHLECTKEIKNQDVSYFKKIIIIGMGTKKNFGLPLRDPGAKIGKEKKLKWTLR